MLSFIIISYSYSSSSELLESQQSQDFGISVLHLTVVAFCDVVKSLIIFVVGVIGAFEVFNKFFVVPVVGTLIFVVGVIGAFEVFNKVFVVPVVVDTYLGSRQSLDVALHEFGQSVQGSPAR